jgi:hypothetical protein
MSVISLVERGREIDMRIFPSKIEWVGCRLGKPIGGESKTGQRK